MIKFIYFDVGGVVIKDFSATSHWEELMAELGIQPTQATQFKNFFKQIEVPACKGKNVESLLPLIADKFHLELPANYSLLNAFVSRFEKNDTIWPVLNAISQKLKVGLLTNMYPDMFEAINRRGLLPKINWSVIVDSSHVSLAKPEPEIYKLAEQKASVSADEILFIDNRQDNLDTAKLLGWQTILYDSNNYSLASSDLFKFINQLETD